MAGPAKLFFGKLAKWSVASASVGGSFWLATDEDLPRKRLAIERALRATCCLGAVGAQYKRLLLKRDRLEHAEYQAELAAIHQWGSLKVLEMCRTNGGLFTKMGQHGATLKPALPDEYVEALATLQDKAAPRPLDEVKAVLMEDLHFGGPDLAGPQSPFQSFDEKPIGSASLAQVHKATLHDGRSVAVKVQHLDIRGVLASDLVIARWLDAAAAYFFKEQEFSLKWAVDEFESNVLLELDFRLEANNALRCRDLIAAGPTEISERLSVPDVMQQWSTDRVLTMEFAEGLPVSKLCKAIRTKLDESRDPNIEVADEDPSLAGVDVQAVGLQLADTLVSTFGAMVFDFGFVHCDPHPGNLLVQLPGKDKPGAPPRFVLLDHGLYRELSEPVRLANCGFWKAMALQDEEGIRASGHTMGIDEKTAAVLPLYFVSRSCRTRAGLGQPITAEEKAELKRELAEAGLLQGNGAGGVSLKGMGALADRVPGDMMYIMRTMHLVGDLHRQLGSSKNRRFWTYMRQAARGHWIKRGGRKSFLDRLIRPLGARFGTWWFQWHLWLREAFLTCFAQWRGSNTTHFSLAGTLGESREEVTHGSLKPA